MKDKKSKVTIHMLTSLDGYIAKNDGSISWMDSNNSYEDGKVLSEEEIENYLKGIDCYIMGSKTYEHALQLGWPYGDTPVFVMTKRNLHSERANVEFCSDDISEILKNRLKPIYKNIWMVGGAQLAKSFIQLKLVDELLISIMPILLGEGKKLFEQIDQEEHLQLIDLTAYKDGIVELHYEIK